MPEATYIICTITSLASAIMLWRSTQAPRNRLLIWGAVFFFGMALNNVLLFVDKVLLPNQAWSSVPPNIVMLASVSALIYGLIWEVT
ncbi:MAG: DUF5985 family protein [Pirellulaceae bacterium]